MIKTRPLHYGLGILTTAFLFFLSASSEAGLIVDQNLIYFSESLANSDEQQASQMVIGFSVSASISKSFQVGWNTNLISRSRTTSSGTETLSGQEFGPAFAMLLGKGQSILLGYAYHPLVQSTYVSTAGSTESWQGTGYQIEFGFLPQIKENLWAGFKVFYDTATYSKSTNSSNLTSTVSYTHSVLVPVVSLSWRF